MRKEKGGRRKEGEEEERLEQLAWNRCPVHGCPVAECMDDASREVVTDAGVGPMQTPLVTQQKMHTENQTPGLPPARCRLTGVPPGRTTTCTGLVSRPSR